MQSVQIMEDRNLIQILKGIYNAKRIYRDRAAQSILERPELMSNLIDKIYDIEDTLHIRAAWVLEIICLRDISMLTPFISRFLKDMHLIQNESALRPVSKICSIWTRTYLLDTNHKVSVTRTEIDQIISCNFDWLIEVHKVATQVHAMDTLYALGYAGNWIHPELKLILQKNTDTGSSGYKAHARKILKNLEKNDA